MLGNKCNIINDLQALWKYCPLYKLAQLKG